MSFSSPNRFSLKSPVLSRALCSCNSRTFSVNRLYSSIDPFSANFSLTDFCLYRGILTRQVAAVITIGHGLLQVSALLHVTKDIGEQQWYKQSGGEYHGENNQTPKCTGTTSQRITTETQDCLVGWEPFASLLLPKCHKSHVNPSGLLFDKLPSA